MGYLIQKDELFKILYDTQEGKISPPPSKICSTLGSFRKKLSLDWLNKIKKHDPKSCLTCAIVTILKYTDHSDASVRVIAYSTLGALLLCVATFDPILFIHAFGNATTQTPISPRPSMAIINMFVYLSRFVSSVKLQGFIIIAPVIDHFKADISDFLKYLPQIIPMMKDIPSTFHLQLLNTLLISCSKRLNSSFTGAVYCLISLNKPLLVPNFKKIVLDNHLNSVVVCLGPTFIGDNEIYELLEEDGRELFLNAALNEFIREPPGFTEFEASCLTCSQFLRYARDTNKYSDLRQRIFTHLKRDYPPHFRRLKLLLPMSLEEILQVHEDTDSMKAAQNFALASCYVDNRGETDSDYLAQIFYSFRFSRNDLYCSLIESFAKCVNLFLIHCKEKYHVKLLKWILKKKNINWVHDMAVANLLCDIDCYLCAKIIPDFFQLAINRLLEFSLSPNNRLFGASITAIKHIVSYDTLHELLSTIIRCDWIDEFSVSRRFELLSTLASIFVSEEFLLFVPIAFECILFFTTTNVVSNACSFLSKVKVSSIPDVIRKFCFDFIASNFESFTHTSMQIPVPGYEVPVAAPNYLDTIDTDIVTNPAFDHESSLTPIRNCFHFCCTLPLEALKETDIFFWFCIELIPLFPQEALEKAFEIQDYKSVNGEVLWNFLFQTFKTSSKDSVTATCCKLFTRSQHRIPGNVDVMLEQYLIEQRSQDPELLYYLFVLVDQLQHDKAIQSVPSMIQGLEQKIASVLLFKLVLVIGREMVDEIDDKYAIALLQYANFYGAEYNDKVNRYLETTPFEEWPLDDDGMNAELITFLVNKHKTQNILQDVGDFSKLDQQHLKFLVDHQEIFKLEGFKDFIDQNPSLFSKIDISPIHQAHSKEIIFTFKPIDETKKIRISTISPFLEKGKIAKFANDSDNESESQKNAIEDQIVFSSSNSLFDSSSNSVIHSYSASLSQSDLLLGLLDSFFQFSKVQLTNDQLDAIFKTIINRASTYKNAILYAIKNKLKIDLDFVLDHPILFFEDHEVFNALLSYLRTQFTKIDQIDQKLIDKIENKTERKIEEKMIIGSKWSEPLKNIVLIDPNYFLKFYTDNTNEFKGVHFRSLIILLYEASFDPVKLHDIIVKHLSVYHGFESVKKKALLLRFIAVTIDSLLKKNLKVEAGFIIGFFNAQLEMIIEYPFPALHQELSNIFKVIIPVEQKYKQYELFIEKFLNETHFNSLFLKSLTFLYTYHQKEIIHSQLFASLFESEVPSFYKIALECLNEIAVSEAPPLSIGIVFECASSVVKIMASLSIEYIALETTVSFVKKLITNRNKFPIQKFFFDNFVITFLSNASSPSYTLSIEVIPFIVDAYPQSVDTLFNLTFSNENFSKIFMNIFESRKQDTIAQKAINDRICTFFVNRPSISLSKLVPYTTKQSKSIESTVCFLLNYLLHLEDCFLPFFLVLRVFIPKYPTLTESFGDIFNTMKIKSRSLSLMLSTSSDVDDIPKSFLYACSETNNVDLIDSEFCMFLANNIISIE